MGYVPDLHKIWVGTSDQQLMALSNEFPGFYRYALIMEEASESERMSIFLIRKNLQESDGEMPRFPYIVRHVGRRNPINIGF